MGSQPQLGLAQGRKWERHKTYPCAAEEISKHEVSKSAPIQAVSREHIVYQALFANPIHGHEGCNPFGRGVVAHDVHTLPNASSVPDRAPSNLRVPGLTHAFYTDIQKDGNRVRVVPIRVLVEAARVRDMALDTCRLPSVHMR